MRVGGYGGLLGVGRVRGVIFSYLNRSNAPLKGPAKSGCAFLCDMCDRDAATYLNV